MRDNPYSFITLQRLVGAADRLTEKKWTGMGRLDWLPAIQDVQDRLASPNFTPYPLQGFDSNKDGKERLLVQLHPADHLLQMVMLQILSAELERIWSDSVHGYRKGKSTYTAASAIVKALSVGRFHIFKSDVADFFPSINLKILSDMLIYHVGQDVATLTISLVKAPVCDENGNIEPSKGLPLGMPLSPILANLYLIGLDNAMINLPVDYIRYGDDIAVAADSEENLEAAEQTLISNLTEISLSLNQSKTRRFCYHDEPFVYMGHTIDASGIYRKIPNSHLQKIISSKADVVEDVPETSFVWETELNRSTRQRLTLYVSEPSVYLKIRQNIIIIQKGKEVLREVPLRRVERVLILEGVLFSSGFVSACISNNIPVLVFVGKGRAFGSIVAGTMPNPLRLRAQYDLHANSEKRLQIAKEILLAKVRAIGMRLRYISSQHEIHQQLENAIENILKAAGTESLMGIEGNLTKTYYSVFAARIKSPGFEFEKRSRRPPKDPINSLLSFTYSLIFGEMQTALLARGLDPHPGFLHALRKNHSALASDLVEPFRPLIADSFVLQIVNSHQVKAEEFEKRSRDAVYMTTNTRRKVLETYEKYISTPCAKESHITWRDLFHSTAIAMLRVILGDCQKLNIPLSAADIGFTKSDDDNFEEQTDENEKSGVEEDSEDCKNISEDTEEEPDAPF